MKKDEQKNLQLQVTLRSKEKLLYSGVATTVSSENERGPFDILSEHANFISLIHNYIIIDHGLPTEQSFQLEKGVMYVVSNKIDVYIGI
jgi:F0F1-type ATP synthase epsilon subunit